MSILEADRARIAAIDAHILTSLECSDWGLDSLSALQGEQAALHERLASYKYPVLTLPNEIISEFFAHFLPIYPVCPPLTGTFSPTNLTHICRAWREIAMTTPELWRAIGFYNEGVRSRHKRYISNLWLSRSGALPLSIDINEIWVDATKILSDFLPHCARWEYLELAISSPLATIDRPMSLLRHIDLSLATTPPVFTLPDAPLLRTAILDADFGVAENVILPWAQLTSLTLLCVSASDCGPILRRTTNLLHCELSLFTQGDSEYAGPDVGLPLLESLTLDSPGGRVLGVLSTFVVPALRSLTIEERFLDSVEPIRSLTAFISKSGCTLRKVHFTGKRIEDAEAYREAFPSTEFSFEFDVY
ncbi:F-box domain-containing protein [Mycena venus]|uniref:F-box domain-containing protein n=1 Tax=Mycena venus TaxID=2733690 RepID=A0A8H6XP53_9AGAR|nr:F-box domain-containing protein [Mycena venus]